MRLFYSLTMPAASPLSGNGDGPPQSAQGYSILPVDVVEVQLNLCRFAYEPIYAPGFSGQDAGVVEQDHCCVLL